MDIDAKLRASLEDHRLSRAERKAMRAWDLDAADRAAVRQRAFTIAKEHVGELGHEVAFEWLEDVMRAVAYHPSREEPASISEVHFSPGSACRKALVRSLRDARVSVDICVFTITDDRLSEIIIKTHQRGVNVRVASDDDKAFDRGSDIERLAAAGIPTRVDKTSAHMHHKFAVFDKSVVATGSYNWTRSASEHNRENILISNEPGLVAAYAGGFDKLWSEFAS